MVIFRLNGPDWARGNNDNLKSEEKKTIICWVDSLEHRLGDLMQESPTPSGLPSKLTDSLSSKPGASCRVSFHCFHLSRKLSTISSNASFPRKILPSSPVPKLKVSRKWRTSLQILQWSDPKHMALSIPVQVAKNVESPLAPSVFLMAEMLRVSIAKSLRAHTCCDLNSSNFLITLYNIIQVFTMKMSLSIFSSGCCLFF